MGKVEDFKFGVSIDRQVYKPKKRESGPEGRGLFYVTYFLSFVTLLYLFFIFGTPLYLWKG